MIFDATTDIGAIKDISLGGLSVISSNMIDELPETCTIGILGGDDKCILRNVKCRRIHYQTYTIKKLDGFSVPGRRFNLAFDNLSNKQKLQLESIIQNHTSLEM